MKQFGGANFEIVGDKHTQTHPNCAYGRNWFLSLYCFSYKKKFDI